MSVNKVHCKYHPTATLIEDIKAGDLICPRCGLVVAERVIDFQSEWRSFANDTDSKDMSRVGEVESNLKSETETSITIQQSTNVRHLDEHGNPLYKSRSTLSSSDRTLKTAHSNIRAMGDRINLPKSITDEAMSLFKQVHESKQLRGRNNEAVATSCLFMACRKMKVPRTFKEICAVSNVSKKDIGKIFKKIVHILSTSVGNATGEDFMARFCYQLGIPKLEKIAKEISKKALDDNMVAGRSPVSIAAASIYMALLAMGIKKEKKDIGEVAGVAEGTLNVVYKLMRPHAEKLFPSNITPVVPLNQLPSF